MAKKLEKEQKKSDIFDASKYTLSSFRLQAIMLILLGFIFYTNSFYNEYALDDGIVIEKNEYVQKGFKGIKKIMSSDAYESFYKQMNAGQQLSGGRYRPLSIVTFAIEQQLFGENGKDKNPTDLSFLRHVGNVLIYLISIIVLFYFLRFYLLKNNPIAAFATCLLFLIHPIHTEVVANVKSRDEIMSFLFIILTFITAFKYRESNKVSILALSLFTYFCALFSKEYAVTLIALLPMLFFICFNDTFFTALLKSSPYIIVFGVYMIIRVKSVGLGASEPSPDVLNNPYLFASADQKLATEIEILNHYIKLLFFPHPLSSDYSYNTIPYTNFGDYKVWLSLFIHIGMIIATVVLFLKRNILAFALAFYWMHLAMVSNIVFDIGATMGERLIYHSSFGFVLVIAWSISKFLEKISEPKARKNIGIAMAAAVVIPAAAKTIERNEQWKNDATLFITDAETVPHSAMVNGNAGKAYIDLSEKPENKDDAQLQKEYTDKAIIHLNRAVKVHPKYVNGYINLGVAYYKKGDLEQAEKNWVTAKKLYPNNPYLTRSYEALAQGYYNKAMRIWKADSLASLQCMEKAVSFQPQKVDYWYNLGGAYYTVGNFQKAKEAWEKTILLNPEHNEAKQGMAALNARGIK